LQELGNKAFMNKNYEEAIEFFTKAIETDPQDPVYYSNSMINGMCKL
jgi:Flp pilus assembly protein TadD